MTENSPTHDQLDKIQTVINNAQADLNNGQNIELPGLNLKVQDACRDVLNLPPAEAKELKPLMLNIISDLNTLEESLKTFQNNLQQTLKDRTDS